MSQGSRDGAGEGAGRAGVLGDYAVLSGTELSAKLVGLVAFVYLARTLPAGDYGAVELAVALSLVGFTGVDFGAGAIGARALALRPSEARAWVGQVTAQRLLFSVLAYFALGAVAWVLASSPRVRDFLWLWMVSLFAMPWIASWLFQGLGWQRAVGPAQLLRMSLFAAGVTWSVRAASDLMRVAIWEVAGVVAMVAYYLLLAARRGVLAPPQWLRRQQSALWRQAAPVGLSELLRSLAQYLPTLVIGAWLGTAALGPFAASQRLLLSGASFVWLYLFTLYPTLVRAVKARAAAAPTEGPASAARLLDASQHVAAAVGLGGALVVSWAGVWLCQRIYGELFRDGAPLLNVLIWWLPLQWLASHARWVLIGAGEQRAELVAQLCGTATTGLILVLGVGVLGVWAGVAAMLGGGAVEWAVAHGYARRRVPGWTGPTRLRWPLLLALLLSPVVWPFGESWQAALVAGGGYAALLAALDRELSASVRRLLSERQSLRP